MERTFIAVTPALDAVARARSGHGLEHPFDRRLSDSPALLRLFRIGDVTAVLVLLGATTLFSIPLPEWESGWLAALDVTISARHLLVLAVLVLGYASAFRLLGVYDRRSAYHHGEVGQLVVASTVGTVPLALAALVTPWFDREDVFFVWCGTIALALLVRGTLRRSIGPRNDEAVTETIIVGSGPQALAFYRRAARQPNRRIVGFVDSCAQPVDPEVRARLLGSLEDLDRILMTTVVDDVMIALPIKSRYEQIEAVMRSCAQAGVQCTHYAHPFQESPLRPTIDSDWSLPAVRMRQVDDEARLFMKRPVDILGAMCGIVMCAPLIAAIAVAVKLTSPGPILFVQERYGYRKRRFGMYKFRTMVVNAEAIQADVESLNEATGHAFKIRDDPRLTPIGSFLRRWSLDEIPQFVNVLRGEMSLVGPRPLSVRDVARFSEGWLMRRFSVRPGLTCLWQVRGRASLTFDEWMALDLQYIDHWSVGLDLRILAQTVPSVLRRTGAA